MAPDARPDDKKHVREIGMNAVIKMMWLMTHINIGATLALIA